MRMCGDDNWLTLDLNRLIVVIRETSSEELVPQVKTVQLLFIYLKLKSRHFNFGY